MGKVALVSWWNATTILFVFHAGIVHRTIPVTFVPFGTPVFGPKLRLPKLRLFLDERTYARMGWLCSRTTSRDSSLPLSEGNEVPVANNHSVVGVEVPSSQALALTGSNLGA